MQTDQSKLRQECKKLMVHHGYFNRGAKKTLSQKIGVPYGTFVMALSGYREGPAYISALNKIQEHFSTTNKTGLGPKKAQG